MLDGSINTSVVLAAVRKRDRDLLRLLLREPELKKHFFTKVGEVLIFDSTRFRDLVSSRQFLPDSYTAYRNAIGLASERNYLSRSREVVLDFPYKDAVLQGGQSRDDHASSEVFLNSILAPDEIDLLLSPKALTNFTRHSSEGSKACTQLHPHDNYIIKGNNLLALHTLRLSRARSFKCIFIDPPYNTGKDSFKYNDRFTHSTWLTFMKNRLEVARDLLTPDGVFWVSLSDREAHYCKVLMDEVFGRENFVADVIWNSTKSVTNTAIISDAHTHLLCYAYDATILKENRATFRLLADSSKFKNPDNDPRGPWVADPFQVGGERPNQLFTITNPNTGKEYRPNPGNSWKNEKKVFDQLLADGRIVFGTTGEAGPQRKRFWSEAADRGKVTTTLWKDLPTTTNGTKHLKDLFQEKVFDNPKPEGLMQRIIQLSTQPGDAVLDYHLGSGTTATTAHKMGRRYVGVEQMDYIHEVPVARLNKVIAGEQGGISADVNWKGGGSFVYCELAPWAATHVAAITAATTAQELKTAVQAIPSRVLRYDLPPDTIDLFVSSLSTDHDLKLKDAQRAALDLLDHNLLYVPLSEIADADLALSQQDQDLNAQFHGR